MPHSRSAGSRAGQWSRTALALALLFASLPLAGRLLLGVWGFYQAVELSALCLILAAYFGFRARRGPALPDGASMLDGAIRLAASGEAGEAIALLTEAARLNPRLWQAFQYRGMLRLQLNAVEEALADFGEAIRLAPAESHLYVLRGHAHALLGDGEDARRDYEAAARLSKKS